MFSFLHDNESFSGEDCWLEFFCAHFERNAQIFPTKLFWHDDRDFQCIKSGVSFSSNFGI